MCRSFPLGDTGALDCVRGTTGRLCLLAGGRQRGSAKMALADTKKRKRKEKKKEKREIERREKNGVFWLQQGRGRAWKMAPASWSIKMAPAGKGKKEEENQMALGSFSKAEREQENGACQPLSLESVPAGPCPSVQYLKIRE